MRVREREREREREGEGERERERGGGRERGSVGHHLCTRVWWHLCQNHNWIS